MFCGGTWIDLESIRISQHKSLSRLWNFLSESSASRSDNRPGPSSASGPRELELLPVQTSSYQTTIPPPLPPHPYKNHARSPTISSPSSSHPAITSVFHTNVHLMPPPDVVSFPSPSSYNLTQWEESLGWVARGWIEGGEIFADGERWALDWPYENAVDGEFGSAWRSRDSTFTPALFSCRCHVGFKGD